MSTTQQTKEQAQQIAIANKERQFEFQGKQYNTLTGKEVKASTQTFLAVTESFHAFITRFKESEESKPTIKEVCDAIQDFCETKGTENLTEYFEKQIDKRVSITRTRESKAEIEAKAIAAHNEALRNKLIAAEIAKFEKANSKKPTPSQQKSIAQQIDKLLA